MLFTYTLIRLFLVKNSQIDEYALKLRLAAISKRSVLEAADRKAESFTVGTAEDSGEA